MRHARRIQLRVWLWMKRCFQLPRSRPAATIGAIIIVGAALVAILAPEIAPHGQQQVGQPFAPPSGQHLLGLDDIGVDVASLLVWGARVSMLVGFTAALGGVAIGSVMGITAGYLGGVADGVLAAITDYCLVIPVLPLAIVIAALWGPSLRNEIIIITLLSWPATARVLRAQVKSIRERVYIRRSQSLGASTLRIVMRHVTPSVSPLIMANMVICVGNAIFFEAALSFLGLGDPTGASWGKMIADAFNRGAVSVGAWWAIVPPGLAIGVVVLGTSMLGRGLEDALNPRLGVDQLGARVIRLRHALDPALTSPSALVVADDRDPSIAALERREAPKVNGCPAILDVNDLHVWFDLGRGNELYAVRGVSLSVSKGERLGLVGESGCGKTTTILAVMGLLAATASVAGSVVWEGEDILARGESSLRPHRWRDVAMVFQGAMNAFNPVRTIGDQIAEPMEVHGVYKGRAARNRVRELLELVGIAGDRADRYPHEFSGGMRQRAAIAMSLACDPKVLLADEPTTALDVMVQAQILELLLRLTDELGLAMILVTHDLPVVAQMCSRAAVMYAGEIVEEGATAELYHNPRHPYTRLLFGATPDLDTETSVRSIPGAPPRLDRPLRGCPFAPRCDHTFERCHEDQPRLREVDAGHIAACHLNDRVLAQAPE